MLSGGCGDDNLAKRGERRVPPLCTSTPAPLSTLELERRELDGAVSGINFPGSLGTEIDLWQEEREEVNKHWKQSRWEDRVSALKSFHKEKDGLESRGLTYCTRDFAQVSSLLQISFSVLYKLFGFLVSSGQITQM